MKLKPQFEQLREHLRALPDLELTSEHYEDAATAFNRCRERGIQGSNTELLICAVLDEARGPSTTSRLVPSTTGPLDQGRR